MAGSVCAAPDGTGRIRARSASERRRIGAESSPRRTRRRVRPISGPAPVGPLAAHALDVHQRHPDQRAGNRLERGREVGVVAPGIVEAVDDPGRTARRRSARRGSAPTIPPQKRSGSQIVKCHRARPIITQASMPISDASRDGGCAPRAWPRPLRLGGAATTPSFSAMSGAGAGASPARGSPSASAASRRRCRRRRPASGLGRACGRRALPALRAGLARGVWAARRGRVGLLACAARRLVSVEVRRARLALLLRDVALHLLELGRRHAVGLGLGEAAGAAASAWRVGSTSAPSRRRRAR